MGRQIEVSGKSVDEAVFKGITELGLSIDEVVIETIQKPSAGILLGIGSKPAIVRITEKDVEAIDIKNILDGKKAEHIKKAKPEPKVKKQPEKSPVMPKENTFEEQNNEQEAPSAAQTAPQIAAEEDIAYSEDLANENEAATFLSNLLKLMNVDAKVLAAEKDGNLKLRIDTESAGMLIGHRGETLDALQYLTLLIANHNREQKEYTRVSIDTQGYREKREEVLVRLARSKASAVRASGRSYRFEPMSPYERRIIHSTLQSNPHVTTHSEGFEPHRYVVITSNHTQRRRYNRHQRPVQANESSQVEE